jgi:predicted HTH domain antitoxin
MSAFVVRLAAKIADYVQLRRSLGHAFEVQAATLKAFEKFVRQRGHAGPLTTC